MLRLRLILFAAAIAILVSAPIFFGCSEDPPTHPGEPGTTHSSLFSGGMSIREDNDPYEIYVQTSAELDTALNDSLGFSLVSGDTLLLKGGVTFLLPNYSYLIQNKTLYIIGESPRPTVKSENTTSNDLITVQDNDQSKTFLWSNIDMDYDSTYTHASRFLHVTGFGTSVIEDVDATLSQSFVMVRALLDTIRDSSFRSIGRSLRTDPYNNVSKIVIDNVSVELLDNYIDSYCVYQGFSTFPCDVTIRDSDFSGGTGKYFLKIYATNRPGGGPVIDLHLIDNDFGNQKALADAPTGLGTTVDIEVLYDGNNSDVCGPCDDGVDDLFVIDEAGIDVTYTFQMPWYYDDHLITLANLGDVNESSDTYVVVKCENTYYLVVAFALEDDAETSMATTSILR